MVRFDSGKQVGLESGPLRDDGLEAGSISLYPDTGVYFHGLDCTISVRAEHIDE